MMCLRLSVACIALQFSFLLCEAQTQEGSVRAGLGTTDKLRILVDKVMQPEAKWITEEWMVKAAADAGFNVFSPRSGYDRLDEVRQVAEWCRKYGISYMPWMRGSLGASDGPDSDGKKVVWDDGSEQPLWSPNSDEFWEWTTRYILDYATIAKENPFFMGVFLDYENYAVGGHGNLYSLSYDSSIMNRFGTENALAAPEVKSSERKAWLEQQGLHEKFSDFQVNYWRQKCKALRSAVDEICPTFQFCVYPAPGTMFMVKAIYPEWSTTRAPLILADASTYGRPSRFQPEKECLEKNRSRLVEGMKVPQAAGIPFIYTGGIDPVVNGADPEFSGKNAVMISEATNGYWIFYEGPTYTKQDHADYWKWFTWANKAIAEGRFDAQNQPRETPENWFLATFERASDGPQLLAPVGTGTTVEYPIVKLRGDNLIVLACTAGKPVEIALQNVPVGRYDSPLCWDLRNPKMEQIASGTVPHAQSGAVQFKPDVDGVYFVGVSSGSCAYTIVKSNAPLALYAAAGLSVIQEAKRLYFSVPPEITEFALSVRGQGAETVRLNVFDPGGQQVATCQTSKAIQDAGVTVKPGEAAGKTWSLELTRADEGVLEDARLTLDTKLPPTLSLVEGEVFRFTP